MRLIRGNATCLFMESPFNAPSAIGIVPKSLEQVPEKIVIFLRATGNAPILKQTKFKVSSAQKFLSIQQFVRKQLLLQEKDPLFLYVNSAFAPCSDAIISHLFKCFSTEGMLIINYSTSAAWG